MGGHIVSGHVDGVAAVLSVTPSGFSRFSSQGAGRSSEIHRAQRLVALDGVSLTVNEVSGAVFAINLIPTTLEVTNWGGRKPGDTVNMEVDLIARYVARLLGQ